MASYLHYTCTLKARGSRETTGVKSNSIPRLHILPALHLVFPRANHCAKQFPVNLLCLFQTLTSSSDLLSQGLHTRGFTSFIIIKVSPESLYAPRFRSVDPDTCCLAVTSDVFCLHPRSYLLVDSAIYWNTI